MLLAKGAKPESEGRQRRQRRRLGHAPAATPPRPTCSTKAGAQLNPFLNVGVMPFALMDKAAGKRRPLSAASAAHGLEHRPGPGRRPCARRRRRRGAARRWSRLEPRQLAQRGVVEDDVRRHAALARHLQAQRAQPLEEVAIDAFPAFGLGLRRARWARVLIGPPLPRQRQVGRGAGVLQQRHAVGGELQHRILVVGLPQQPVRQQLVDVAAHLVDRARRAAARTTVSVSWPRAVTCSLSLPRRTLVTCAGAEALPDARHARQDLARHGHRRRPPPRARRGSSRRRRSRPCA